ncbi:hypothetical protein ACFX1X_032164 [Malus domestica]
MGKPRGFPNGNFSKLNSQAPALFFCRTTRAHARVKRTRLTQPSGSRAGNPRRACSSGLACRSGFPTLEGWPCNETIFLESHSKAEIVDMLRKHSYVNELEMYKHKLLNAGVSDGGRKRSQCHVDPIDACYERELLFREGGDAKRCREVESPRNVDSPGFREIPAGRVAEPLAAVQDDGVVRLFGVNIMKTCKSCIVDNSRCWRLGASLR